MLCHAARFSSFFMGGRLMGAAGLHATRILASPLAPPTVAMIADACQAPWASVRELIPGNDRVATPEGVTPFWAHHPAAAHASSLLRHVLGSQAVAGMLQGRTHGHGVPSSNRWQSRSSVGALGAYVSWGHGVDVAGSEAALSADGEARCGGAVATLEAVLGATCMTPPCSAVGHLGVRTIMADEEVGTRSAWLGVCGTVLTDMGLGHVVYRPPSWMDGQPMSRVVVPDVSDGQIAMAGGGVDVAVVDVAAAHRRVVALSEREVSASKAWLPEWLAQRHLTLRGTSGRLQVCEPVDGSFVGHVGAVVARWWDRVAANGTLVVVLPASYSEGWVGVEDVENKPHACVPVSLVSAVEAAVGARVPAGLHGTSGVPQQCAWRGAAATKLDVPGSVVHSLGASMPVSPAHESLWLGTHEVAVRVSRLWGEDWREGGTGHRHVTTCGWRSPSDQQLVKSIMGGVIGAPLVLVITRL